MIKISRANRTSGFTIVELLIATTVFALVLMGALAGFLEIGHLFYKGVSTSNTQAVANQVLQDISGQFRTNGNFVNGSADGYNYYCIGSTRYTYNINHELDTSVGPDHRSPASGGDYGLLKDVLPGSSGCATPCSDDTTAVPVCPGSAVRFQNPVELLGDKMRLSAFSVTPAATGSNFYNVSIVVAYGDDDAFDNPDNPSITCNTQSGIEQFCSVSRLDTSAYKGFSL